MSSPTLRRRLYHGDVDGGRNDRIDSSTSDALHQPLLPTSAHTPQDYEDEEEEDWDIRKKQQLHWTYLFSSLVAQWAHWLATILTESSSVFTRLLTFSSQGSIYLSPLQEERLSNLKERLQVPFDGSLLVHQDALRQLWRLAFPDATIPPLKSEAWKEMGWQGNDPSTDFRGGGYISLENLIYFAQNYPESFQKLLHKQEGARAEWEYPFAVAGVNISFMLIQMLDLQSTSIPSSQAGVRFLELLAVDENAFDKLYCVAFQLMDAQWLVKRASYMEFNEVLKSTRTQLERELALEDVTHVRDLPSYTMLYR